MFSDYFDVLMSKIFKKKHYFNTFPNKKHFEKQPLPHSQTSLTNISQRLLFFLKI